MTKSNRQRKRDRSKREARAAQKHAVVQRRQASAELVRNMTETVGRIADPGTPPEEVAGLMAEFYEGPVPTGLADRMLAEGSSPERLASIAKIMITAGGPDDRETPAGETAGSADEIPPSVTALTFAAAAARAAGDGETAHRLLDQAVTVADDPDTRADMIDHLRHAGRVADAIELFEAMLRETPEDGHAAEHYGHAIEDAYARNSAEEPGGACSCGRGASWLECCAPRERAALERFTDRSGLIALQDAVVGYLAESEHGRAVDDEVAEVLSITDQIDWEPAERAALAELLYEHALASVRLAADGDAEDTSGPPNEDQHETEKDGPAADRPMTAFAASPSVAAALATRAADWRHHIHYGVWRIGSPHPAPGLWCTDITSRATRYAQFPAGLIDGMPRWTVWLGALVPVDGIWRTTGRGVWLTPAEADAVAEFVLHAATTSLSDITGMPKKGSLPRTEWLRFGRAEPVGVYADHHVRQVPLVARVFSWVTGGQLGAIVARVQMHRSALPGFVSSVGGFPRDAAPATEGWEKHWVDERVPALRGRTPRQSAARDKERPLVEGLLRQFEYETDLLTAEGKPAIDAAWLRQELGMRN